MKKLEQIKAKFKQLHNSEPLIVRSPGRVNLIGEHTDYNLGPVLPAAIDKNIFLAVNFREDNIINIYAADYSDQVATTLDNLEPAWKLWPNYTLGVIKEFQKAGCELRGMNIVFGGDIPLAAGLSSSAAITCATAFAINTLYNFDKSPLELAKIAQAAEHNYVGVHCGLMDQFASIFGKEGYFIKLDCNTTEYSYIPYTAKDIKIVLFDSGVKHFLVSSAYNERRKQCAEGVKLVKQNLPAVNSLADVTEAMLLQYVKPVNNEIFKRCLYVVEEIERLREVCKDLTANNFDALGKRLFETHKGLRDLYEVSCNECDFLVDFVENKTQGVLGARMMGAGFGGCTVNLIHENEVDRVVEELREAYKKAYNKDLKVYFASIGNGSEVMQNPFGSALTGEKVLNQKASSN